jgi:hypothetical protein
MAKSARKPFDREQEELLLRNHERVGRGLIFLAQGLQPFVESQMQKFHGDGWEEVAKVCLGDKEFHIESDRINLEDSQALIQVIINQRQEVFESVLSRNDIDLVFKLRAVRRKWAHPRLKDWNKLQDFTPRYTYRELDRMHQLLSAISAEEAAKKLEALIQEVVPLLQGKSQAEDKEQQKLIEEKTEGFVGRGFVFEAIEKFLTSEPNGYFIIEGEPGIGKSAILAKYVQRTGCIAHVNVRSQGITSVERFLKNVCTQLISRYNLPYSSLPPDATRDSQFFGQLLGEVSAKLKTGDRLVIAIDALDEVDRTDHTGANLLYLPARLDKGVYFVMTQRPGTLPLTVNTPPHRFDLMQHQEQSLQDIQTYIRGEVKKSSKLQAWIDEKGLTVEEFITQLANKSENNFMYLKFVLHDIKGNKYRDLSIENLPQGLEAYYEDHWRRMGMTDKERKRTKIKIVYVLAELREPVSRELIGEFSGEDAFTVQEVLDEDELQQFLHKDKVDGETRYSVYHLSFCDFLARKDIVQAAGVTLQGINALIANNLTQRVFGDE